MITILHLYPRELGINGDIGNVMALVKRAEWRGMPVRVVNHGPGDTLPDTVQLVHIGSGPVSAQELVRSDVVAIAAQLRAWAASGVPVLAIAGGWQLLGRTLTDLDGVVHEGAGVFPTNAVLTQRRTVDEYWHDDLAGFVNYGARTTATTTTATATGVDDELIEHGQSVATNLHGPFLPMNPLWADRLLQRAATLAGAPMGEPDARTVEVDRRAANARNAIRKRLGA